MTYSTRRSRYGSASIYEGGYLSDGGYHRHGSDTRLNKARSMEDLTSTRGRVYGHSASNSRSTGNAYGGTGSGSRYLSTNDRPNPGFRGDSRRLYASSGYGSRDDLTRRGLYEYKGGSTDNLSSVLRSNAGDARFSSSKQSEGYRTRDSGTKIGGILHGGAGNQSDSEQNKVRYRISGEIVRANSPEDRVRGYNSDTGVASQARIGDSRYSNEVVRGYKDRTSRFGLQNRSDTGYKGYQWRSKSSERNDIEYRLQEGADRQGLNEPLQSTGYPGGRVAERMPEDGPRGRSPDRSDYRLDPYRNRSRSASPMHRPTSGAMGKIGSPSRKPRKATNSSNLARGGRPRVDVDDPASFPVCSRWPNCTVCSIDIPSSQVVSHILFYFLPKFCFFIQE